MVYEYLSFKFNRFFGYDVRFFFLEKNRLGCVDVFFSVDFFL